MWDSYGRLSRVPETGELEKIDTQWADNRAVIERYGAVLGEELSDGLSARRPHIPRDTNTAAGGSTTLRAWCFQPAGRASDMTATISRTSNSGKMKTPP